MADAILMMYQSHGFVPAEENQKKYAENDERFKSSPIVKELLERSKQNKEKYDP